MTKIEFDLPVLSEIFQRLGNIDEKLESIRNGKPPKEVWLTTKEAAQVLKVSTRTVQTYRDQGVLPFSQFGREVRYRLEDLQQFLISHYSRKLQP